MSDVTFRYARQADAPAIVALIELAYRNPDTAGAWSSEAHLLKGPRTSLSEISELIAREDTRFLLAETGGRLAGCCLLQGLHRDDHGATHPGAINAAYFGMFAIDPANHGGGLGKIVIAEAEARPLERQPDGDDRDQPPDRPHRVVPAPWLPPHRRNPALPLQRDQRRNHPRLPPRRNAQGSSLGGSDRPSSGTKWGVMRR